MIPHLAPGLRELAAEKNLSDETVRKLDRMWGTIRGKKPTTLDEWLPLWAAIRHYAEKEPIDDANQ